MQFRYAKGATPLNLDELAELIPRITTQRELNELEKANIIEARSWAIKSRKLKRNLLSYSGLLLLHGKMFDQVWRWAGKQRRTEKNIGVDPRRIPEDTENLCRNVLCWFEHKHFSDAELAVRFHHELVKIHPFANGNGRHARLAANLFLRYNNCPELTWGSMELGSEGKKRAEYLTALRDADNGKYARLIKFAQT